jgi:hypothetical protein
MAAVAGGIASSAPSAHAEFPYLALYWTPWVSEEDGGPWTVCSQWDEAAVGFGCRGDRCDDVRILCETFPGGMTLDTSTTYYGGWFSEEGALPPGVGSTEPAGNQTKCRMYIDGTIDSWTAGVVSGVHCRGAYCDDLQVECEAPVKFRGSTPVRAKANACHTVGPYSDEQGSQDFGPNNYIYGITCTGGWCDKKKFDVCTFTVPF